MAKQKYNVELSRRAEQMLLRHTEFLAGVSLYAAGKFIQHSKKTEAKLADNPELYPYADESDVPGIPIKTYKKCVFDKRYKAIFIIEENNVFIDAIIDCRQENKNLYSDSD